jgi:hypothetical protein
MARSFVGKIAVASLIAAILFVLSLPIGLYGLGLLNIEGRPEPPMQTSNLETDADYLQQAFRRSEPLSIRAPNPWSYAVSLLSEGNDYNSDDGSIATWVIARNYNSAHLKNRQMTFRHLSGAALTIWISRNWTAEQIVTAAATITRSRPKPYFIARSGQSPRA